MGALSFILSYHLRISYMFDYKMINFLRDKINEYISVRSCSNRDKTLQNQAFCAKIYDFEEQVNWFWIELTLF